jgi:hypothetical protein
MTEILLRWVREDIGISKVSSDLDKECANGIVFGKILHHYGLFPEYEKMIHKSTPEAKLSNFQRLVPALKALSIRFNSQIANELMTEEHGVALKMLQQLKSQLDTGKRARESLGGAVSSKLLLPIRTTHIPKYKTVQDQTFDAMRQLKSTNPKEYRIQHFLKRFEQEAVDQQRNAEQDEDRVQKEKTLFLSDLRDTHLRKLKDNREYLTTWEQDGYTNHKKNQTDKLEREKRDLRLELAIREKNRRKASLENLVASDEALSGIDNFEESLRRLQVGFEQLR